MVPDRPNDLLAYYRRHAKAYREQANRAKTPIWRETLLDRAKTFENQAADLEAHMALSSEPAQSRP